MKTRVEFILGRIARTECKDEAYCYRSSVVCIEPHSGEISRPNLTIFRAPKRLPNCVQSLIGKLFAKFRVNL